MQVMPRQLLLGGKLLGLIHLVVEVHTENGELLGVLRLQFFQFSDTAPDRSTDQTPSCREL